MGRHHKIRVVDDTNAIRTLASDVWSGHTAVVHEISGNDFDVENIAEVDVGIACYVGRYWQNTTVT